MDFQKLLIFGGINYCDLQNVQVTFDSVVNDLITRYVLNCVFALW